MVRIKRFLEHQRMDNLVRQVDLKGDEIELRARNLYSERYNGALVDNYEFDVYLVGTNTVVGFCDLRLGDRLALLYLGNIGYSILFPYRGHGYASKAVTILLRLAKLLGESAVYITCNPDNYASVATIEKLEAVLINRVDVPKKDPLYKQGDREKFIYKIELKDNKNEQSTT